MVLTTHWPTTMVFTYWAATPLIIDVIVKATRCTNTTKFKLVVDEGVAHYLTITLAHHCDWVGILSYWSFTPHESESRGSDLPRIVYFRVQAYQIMGIFTILELRK